MANYIYIYYSDLMRIWYGIFDWNIQYIKLLDLIWYLGVSENGYAPKLAILSDDDKAVDLGIPIFRQALELVMDRNWICTSIDHVCNQSSVKHTMAIFGIYGCGPHPLNHIDMSSKAAPTTRTTGDNDYDSKRRCFLLSLTPSLYV